MKSIHKVRKQKQKADKKLQIPLNEELANILKSINLFLKKYFELSETHPHDYQERVKQFFILHSTNIEYSCGFSSLFSKLGNMLQPFLHIIPNSLHPTCSFTNKSQFQQSRMGVSNYQSKSNLPKNRSITDEKYESEYQLRNQIGYLEGRNKKLQRKIKHLKEQLNKHRGVNQRLTNFMYMLRVNNIDVDTLYQKGCLQMEIQASPNKKVQISQSKQVQKNTARYLDNYCTN